jgi:phosphonate transport system substrate-binding protein
VLYSNYERQVDAHLRGDFHVAWNSPLAWIQALRIARKHGRDAQAIAMRDTDRDLTSVVLVREDSPVKSLADLRGKRVGVGAADSPQATLIPLLSFADAGVDVEVVRHDVLVGKNRLAFAREGLGPTLVVHVTDKYDHCNMTVLDGAPAGVAKFRELLLAMSYDDPQVRPLLDMEGLKVWQPGRTSGYALLERACDRFGTLDAWLAER